MKLMIHLIVGSFALSLAACGSIELKPEGNFVRIVPTTPAGCDLLGAVSGHQGNLVTGPVTAQADLTLGARNDLVNGAVALGADTVVLTDPLPNSTPLSVGYEGRAYRCMSEQVAIR